MEDDDRHYVVMTGVIMLSAGAVVGLAHYGLFRAFLEAIRAADELARVDSHGLAPFAIFIIASAVSGWGLSWLAERRNVSSVPPVLLSVAVALGSAIAITVASIRPLPGMTLYLFLASGIAMIAAMIARWRIES